MEHIRFTVSSVPTGIRDDYKQIGAFHNKNLAPEGSFDSFIL